MKTKLNLTIDEELIPISKRYAKSRGMSVSQLVEELLKRATEKERTTFSEKWRGRFRAVEKLEPRYQRLKERFLS